MYKQYASKLDDSCLINVDNFALSLIQQGPQAILILEGVLQEINHIDDAYKVRIYNNGFFEINDNVRDVLAALDFNKGYSIQTWNIPVKNLDITLIDSFYNCSFAFNDVDHNQIILNSDSVKSALMQFKKADAITSANPVAALGESPNEILFYALEIGDITLLRKTLQEGADVNARRKFSLPNFTPLMLAANRGNIEAVILLVEHGANINAIYYFPLLSTKSLCSFFSSLIPSPKTAEAIAVENGHKTIASYLKSLHPTSAKIALGRSVYGIGDETSIVDYLHKLDEFIKINKNKFNHPDNKDKIQKARLAVNLLFKYVLFNYKDLPWKNVLICFYKERDDIVRKLLEISIYLSIFNSDSIGDEYADMLATLCYIAERCSIKLDNKISALISLSKCLAHSLSASIIANYLLGGILNEPDMRNILLGLASIQESLLNIYQEFNKENNVPPEIINYINKVWQSSMTKDRLDEVFSDLNDGYKINIPEQSSEIVETTTSTLSLSSVEQNQYNPTRYEV